MLVHEFAHFYGQLVFHAVIHGLAGFPAGKDSRSGEEGEVLGDVGLGRPDGGHDFINGTGFPANGLQNFKPHWFAENAKVQGYPI